MITLLQYFGDKQHSPEQEAAAFDLVCRVNALREEAESVGIRCNQIDLDTGTEISGSRGGSGDGGFRLPGAVTGRPKSSHKEAKAVDVFDPDNALDEWLDEYDYDDGQNAMLEKHGLYRESPKATIGWCHLQTRRPASGRRTYEP